MGLPEPEQTPDYTNWSASQLLKRITDLEAQLRNNRIVPVTDPSVTAALPPKKKQKKDRPFDASRYNTRHIALKFAYLGQRYNGFEHHTGNKTPLPTIEEELWKAFMKTRLIFPTRGAELKEGEIDWEGTDYSKCGRTDRGVSAFGQVIGIRVRSLQPMPKEQPVQEEEQGDKMQGIEGNAKEQGSKEDKKPESKPWDHIRDELPYIQLLNRVLPEDIRMLAWCPTPPTDFNARFNCRERRYRYFFTSPAFAPVPGDAGLMTTATGKTLREGYLDIEAMRDAAKRYEGLHDFRNFCKVDPAKQITNFERRIFKASIEEVDVSQAPAGFISHPAFAQSVGAKNQMGGQGDMSIPKIYTFDVNGSAFLWHQVRHLVAVLFLVGQGFEPPSIISDLLDMEKYPTRPKYEMATDAPLVLWDCIFPDHEDIDQSREDAMEWVYVGETGGRETNKRPEMDGGDSKFGKGGIMDSIWEVWHKRKIDEILAGSLMDIVAAQGKRSPADVKLAPVTERSPRLFDGGDWPRPVGTYVPIARKQRMEPVEVVNARYLERKGPYKPKFMRKEDGDE
ncbi:pseudouridine synthase [Aureobasidium pullulans]|uniref:Pseudouridine synthase n=1 Tax=Aureobasidium pullulans TaxID=5580 RepID=A0A4S8VL92_AURPU|nr:pseudouridine synthase [Aureobasidium pullulans]THZ18563.1 pseudouridine synthase [Aureobasidium pullulans]